uniref:Uncharacterized protein n=1 Tax=Sphaerodactylus townsendi TaxID=933632 RepID=A0ACB8G186_9SAUR
MVRQASPLINEMSKRDQNGHRFFWRPAAAAKKAPSERHAGGFPPAAASREARLYACLRRLRSAKGQAAGQDRKQRAQSTDCVRRQSGSGVHGRPTAATPGITPDDAGPLDGRDEILRDYKMKSLIADQNPFPF